MSGSVAVPSPTAAPARASMSRPLSPPSPGPALSPLSLPDLLPTASGCGLVTNASCSTTS